jgi:hypothetical protein
MPITAQFTADFSLFTAAAEGAKAALDDVKGGAEGIGFNVEQQAHIAAAAIGEFGRQVGVVAKDYIGAFAEEEAATQRLTTALRNQGTASTEVISQYAAMASQFQQTTRYSDDAIIAAQTAFTQIGKIGPEQMQPAIEAAANMAAALGIGIEEAAIKMSKAIASGGEKLGTLKQTFSDVDLKGKSAAEMLDLFNSKFGGAAQADMDTTAGKLTNLQNKLDDLKGKIGGILADALGPLLEAFSSLPDFVQTGIIAVVGLGTALAPLAITFSTMVTAIGPLIPLIGTALVGAFSALLPFLGPIGLIALGVGAIYAAFKYWDNITAIVAAVYTGIKTYLVDKFMAVVNSVVGLVARVQGAFAALKNTLVGNSIVPDMVSMIGEEFAGLGALMVRPAEAATAATAAAFGAMQDAIGDGPGALVGAGAPALYAPAGGGLIPAAAGGTLVTNTFNLVDTESNLARKVSDLLMRSVTQARRV